MARVSTKDIGVSECCCYYSGKGEGEGKGKGEGEGEGEGKVHPITRHEGP